MHISNKNSNFALSNKKNNSKTFRTMKNETKKKIAAVSAVFTIATLVSTIILVANEHPAQWYFAGVCMLGMIITFAFVCSIDC